MEAGDYHDVLPELPVIEVHSLVDLSTSKDRGKGKAGKEGELSGKGVRFADVVQSVDNTTPVREKERDEKKDRETEKGKKEDGKEMRVEKDMDSVDFDQVKGTSTPINEDSLSLPKHTASSTAQTQTFSDSSNSYNAASEHHGDGEDNGMDKESPLAPHDDKHEPSQEGNQS